MAYNDSGELPGSQSTYSLGGYTFELKVQNVHEPGEEEVVSIFAVCHGPDGSRETQAVDFPVGTTVESWSVEANETEASVYAILEIGSEFGEGPWPNPVNAAYGEVQNGASPRTLERYDGYIAFLLGPDNYRRENFMCSASPGVGFFDPGTGSWPSNINVNTPYTYNGKTVYYASLGNGLFLSALSGGVNYYVDSSGGGLDIAKAAWTVLYGSSLSDSGEHLIARFAIDLREADGGPDGDWDEPGDTGDPSYTLNVNVTGASAGTHDAAAVPMAPADQPVYGSGGAGGNGGGGGAGASTVIIYEFVTDKAGSVNQEAYAREAGAGGPGGPGGRGADGCIIIFY